MGYPDAPRDPLPPFGSPLKTYADRVFALANSYALSLYITNPAWYEWAAGSTPQPPAKWWGHWAQASMGDPFNVGAGGKAFGFKVTQIKNSLDTIYLTERVGANSVFAAGYEWGQVDHPGHAGTPKGPYNPDKTDNIYNFASWRTSHRGRASALFLDMHAESITWAQCNNPATTATRRPNRWMTSPP
jgi:hypothetical protein